MSTLRDLIEMWEGDVEQFAIDNFDFQPDSWQLKVFKLWDQGLYDKAFRAIAMKAAKGPGKTAVIAILMWHFVSMHYMAKCAATSITGDNLSDCLWAELAKWQERSVFLKKHFTWRKTRIENVDEPENWFMSARTWPKDGDAQAQANTLAGLHADFMLFVLDEAGEIPEGVLAAAEASQASGVDCRILVAGNPISLEGALYAACEKRAGMYKVIEITGDPDDPDRSPRIDIEFVKRQIELYGRDNPWIKANYLGEFPSSNLTTFIPITLIRDAEAREPENALWDPFVIGVDVARFGDDRSVVFFRKGRDAKTHPPVVYRGLDNMQLATRIKQHAEFFNADAIMVDAGNGGGVVDRLRQLGAQGVFEIHFNSKPDALSMGDETENYYNKRAEMYGNARQWLRRGALHRDAQLSEELAAPKYTFVFRDGKERILLEPKDDIKVRLGRSPDMADAFALTFAYPVSVRKGQAGYQGAGLQRKQNIAEHEYDPFKDA